MPRQLQLGCSRCGTITPHLQPTPNHLLHLLLSVFTAGIWLVVWILLTIGAGKTPAQCSACGTQRNVLAA